jgi:hypothetical protein
MQRIVYKTDSGVSIVIPSPEALEAMTIEEIAAKDVPAGMEYTIVSADDLPADWTFRDAWRQNGSSVYVDLPAAKAIAHTHRRTKRSQEFEPHDRIIAAQIPGESASAAEAARSQIRQRYAVLQDQIDAAGDIKSLKAVYDRIESAG